jgi:hypothetical protein
VVIDTTLSAALGKWLTRETRAKQVVIGHQAIDLSQ